MKGVRATMIIEYEKNKYVTEIKQLEITDSKNVFLKGKNMYDNLPTYFGIWENNGGLSIVTIIRYCIISYKYYLSTNLSTVCDIQEYLKNSNNVEIINKDEFKEQIEKGGFILAHWDGTPETEDRIKEETKATIRCLPFDADEESLTPGKCMVTGKPSARRVLFARAY